MNIFGNKEQDPAVPANAETPTESQTLAPDAFVEKTETQPEHSDDFETLQKEHHSLKEELVKAKAEVNYLGTLVDQAFKDGKAFINQVDREGLGMQTVTDHRKRVDKFLTQVANTGRA